MFKTVDFFFIALVLAVGAATYVIKFGSESESNGIAKLEREIKIEKEAIDVLNANWSLLTSPSRIQNLVERYGDELELENLEPQQVTTIDQIPLKPIETQSERRAQNAEGNSAISDFITGSINNGEATQ
ncbi:MAG: hypothetical protein L3J32_10265 [Rhizobiaceae bacterium]|nr:hypothetical protein [Rhizobiaceae bacterium]